MADVLTERRGSILWITLNRPDVRNALSLDVNTQLIDICSDLDGDRDARAVVITGTGDKAFCAGADLKERKGVPAGESSRYINAIGAAINGIAELRQPTICAMNGSAYGGGLELAMACDLRVIVEGAELGLTEVRLGIMPGAGGTQRLPRLVGEARAKEMILLGRRIDATRAHAIGLVHQVVQRAQLMATVDGILNELAGCAPLSVKQAKSAIEQGYGRSMSDGLALEREHYEVTLFSEDRDEGLAAFAAGRPPNFTGQ